MHKTKFTCYYVKVEDDYTEEIEHVSFGEEVDENGNKGDPFKRVRWYYPELSGLDAEAILGVHQIEGSFLLRSRLASREGAPVSHKEYSLNVWCEKRSWQYKVEYKCEDGSVKFGLKNYGSVKEFDFKMRRGYQISNGVYNLHLKTPIPNISEPSITKEKDFNVEIAKLSRRTDIIYLGDDGKQTNISAIHSRKVNCEHEVHSGYLTKQGHLVKNWKKRWFTLRRNNLSYYKNNNKGQSAINTINLDTIYQIIENDHNYKKEYCFTIVGKDGYRLTMEADTEAEYKRWTEKLSRIIKLNKFQNTYS